MLIHLTDKLRTKMHFPPLDPFEEEAPVHLNWYANLFTANRVQYIITTNAASLLSIITYGRGVTDVDPYLKTFLPELREYLEEMNLQHIYHQCIQPHLGSIIFAKPTNRSVLSSMRVAILDCQAILNQRDEPPHLLAQLINQSPRKAIQFRKPPEVFVQLPYPDKIPD